MKVGFIGWRGMVGSVLMQRMRRSAISTDRAGFFTTSQAGARGPAIGGTAQPVKDARDIEALGARRAHLLPGRRLHQRDLPEAARAGWKGYWIDAASALRMRDDAVIILDPVNMDVIERARQGVKNFIGGNCTVSSC